MFFRRKGSTVSKHNLQTANNVALTSDSRLINEKVLLYDLINKFIELIKWNIDIDEKTNLFLFAVPILFWTVVLILMIIALKYFISCICNVVCGTNGKINGRSIKHQPTDLKKRIKNNKFPETKVIPQKGIEKVLNQIENDYEDEYDEEEISDEDDDDDDDDDEKYDINNLLYNEIVAAIGLDSKQIEYLKAYLKHNQRKRLKNKKNKRQRKKLNSKVLENLDPVVDELSDLDSKLSSSQTLTSSLYDELKINLELIKTHKNKFKACQLFPDQNQNLNGYKRLNSSANNRSAMAPVNIANNQPGTVNATKSELKKRQNSVDTNKPKSFMNFLKPNRSLSVKSVIDNVNKNPVIKETISGTTDQKKNFPFKHLSNSAIINSKTKSPHFAKSIRKSSNINFILTEQNFNSTLDPATSKEFICGKSKQELNLRNKSNIIANMSQIVRNKVSSLVHNKKSKIKIETCGLRKSKLNLEMRSPQKSRLNLEKHGHQKSKLNLETHDHQKSKLNNEKYARQKSILNIQKQVT